MFITNAFNALCLSTNNKKGSGGTGADVEKGETTVCLQRFKE
jgi:hypothetical protein